MFSSCASFTSERQRSRLHIEKVWDLQCSARKPAHWSWYYTVTQSTYINTDYTQPFMGTVFPDDCDRGNALYYTAKQFEEQRNQSVDGLQISQNSDWAPAWSRDKKET